MIPKILTDTFQKKNEGIILSYRSLRRLIGIFGIGLPLINIIGGVLFANIGILPSVSMYYHSNMRDFLEGFLFVIGFFLITYKGEKVIDFIVTTISGVFCLGVSIFPCRGYYDNAAKIGIFHINASTSDLIHLICAAAFLILLALNSLFLFTRNNSESNTISPEKKNRNIIYIVCGIVICISLLAIVFCSRILPANIKTGYKTTLISETVALIAFGTSWLVKGETLFRENSSRRDVGTAVYKTMSA